ncbi:MAG: dihydroxy-acid dehydratase [Archaeoglobaceae archaeon]|nr:dihydroxy-acid dehydratase [Archaeoglobaceae archaeon]
MKRTYVLLSELVPDEEIIRPLNNPLHKEGGIAILRGNLAPKGAVVKTSAMSEKMMKFNGSARVFNSEEEAVSAILSREIQPITAVVDGDEIEIDIPNRSLSVLLEEDEIKKRLSKIPEFAPKETKGSLYRYAKLASSADEGGILK